MKSFMISIIIFISIYLLYIITVVCNKKKLETFEKSTQALFIIKRYQLNDSNINKKSFAHVLAFTNSFIIALTFFVTEFVNNMILKLSIGFLMFIPLILFGYHLIGLYYRKK